MFSKAADWPDLVASRRLDFFPMLKYWPLHVSDSMIRFDWNVGLYTSLIDSMIRFDSIRFDSIRFIRFDSFVSIGRIRFSHYYLPKKFTEIRSYRACRAPITGLHADPRAMLHPSTPASRLDPACGNGARAGPCRLSRLPALRLRSQANFISVY